MPRIRTYTAETGPGVQQAPQVSADSFGAQAFQGITQLGRSFSAVGQKIQQNQDQLDLIRLSGEYEVGLDQKKAEIASHPDLESHGQMFQDASQTLHDDLVKANPGVSSAVQTAFKGHAMKLSTTAQIDLAHQGREIAVERQVVDLHARAESLVDVQAMVPPGEAFGRDTSHIPGRVRNTVDHLLTSFTKNGTLHPLKAEQLRESLNHRYWEQRATEYPEQVMQVVASGKLGFDDFNMDQAKSQHYNALAVSVLHGRQAEADKAVRAQEAVVKATQETNARMLTADILEGKPTGAAIPTLLRTRELSDNDGRTLTEFQRTLANAPNLANYQKGYAAKIEAKLEQQKYDNKPLDPRMAMGLVDDFNAGRIVKDEFTHLMGVVRGVDDYKHQTGKESANQNVSHAHSNMVGDLQTTGPADKFDALSKQTIEEADKFFWRKVGQDPNADPWKVAEEAGKIFKPVIEKRLGLSKTDKAVLDDARMVGLVHTKAISPAAHKAYKDKTQAEEGWRIVQETLKNLPPPPPPGFFERFKGINPFKKNEAAAAKPRNAPGVMGGE